MDAARVETWAGLSGVAHGFGRREAADPSEAPLFLLKQVHGTALAQPPWPAPPEADAAATAARGQLLGIKTADCLPVLFVDPTRRLVAAAHAGWRGTASGIVRHVVDWFRAQGAPATDLWVALGPAAGSCCYEVGDELRAHFAADEQRFFVPGRGAKPHLDVRGVNEHQLRAAGVRPDRIAHVAECTQCRPDLYYSYRREGKGTGRMISYVGLV
jgi:polyphenol oxidase